MGLSRLLYSLFGGKLRMRPSLSVAALGCIGGYALCAFAPASLPVLGLIGCGIVGFSVGILWPGTFSLSTARLPQGGTAMFALLALAGDVGCAAGPSAVGALSDALGGDLRMGIAFGIFFPLLMLVALFFFREKGTPPALLPHD